ncbi:MAG: hypothetical protein L6Q40_05405 [Azonexus sp.]|nr:hypothetical protein [Azonexus sp.]
MGHTLSKLSIDQPTVDRIGLFGTLSGTVRNLQLSQFNLRSKTYLGAIAGKLTSTGHIANVQVQGSLSGIGYNGGAVDYRGGIVGYNQGGRISDTFADITILGDDHLGGIAGYSDGIIERSGAYVKLSLHPTSQPYYGWVGGLVGEHGNGGSISDSYALGSVAGGTHGSLGGLVGLNRGAAKINRSFASVAVTRLPGDSLAGGLVGYNEQGGIINGSYWNTAHYATSGGGSGLSASALNVASNFVGWSLSSDLSASSTWYSNGSSAPVLRNQLSTNRWLGLAGDQQWATATNWTLGHAPLAWENALVTTTSAITLAGVQSAKNLVSNAPLSIAAASSLNLAQDSRLQAGLALTSADAALQLGNGSLKLQAGDTQAIQLDGTLQAPQIAFTTEGSGTLTQAASGRIVADQLTLETVGAATLSGTSNQIRRLQGEAEQLTLKNQGDLALGPLSLTQGNLSTTGQLTVSGNVQLDGANSDAASTVGLILNAGSDLVLQSRISSNRDVTLVAGGNFRVDGGDLAPNTGKRWLVYSTDPSSDSPGALLANFRHYGLEYDPTRAYSGPGSGNGFIHRTSLTADIVATALHKIYDSTATALVSPSVLSLNGSGTAFLNATFSYDSATYDTPHVGSNKAVTLNGLNVTVNEGSTAVYGVQFNPALRGEISTATLTLSAQADQREYRLGSDGQALTTSTLIPISRGLQGSDSISALTQAFDSGLVGSTTLSIQPGYVINDGNGGANYAVRLLSAAGTVTGPAADLTTLSYQPTTRSLSLLSTQLSQSNAGATGNESDESRLSDDPTLRQCR